MPSHARAPQAQQAPEAALVRAPATEADQGNAAALEATGQAQGEQAGLEAFGELIGGAFVAAEQAAIPTRDIVYEQLAHGLAYLDSDQAAVDGIVLSDLGYVEAGRIDDPATGLHAVAFAPAPSELLRSEGLPQPEVGVMVFRGTEPSADRGKDVIDDANPAGVGYGQFEANEAEIAALMGSLGSCDVSGHSLGGALAKLAACRIGGVRDIVTFQAPGIDEADLALLEEGVESTHYRCKGDVVDNAGEAHTEGEVVELDTKGLDGPEGHLDMLLVEAGEARGIEGLEGNGTEIEGIERSHTRDDDQRYEDIRREAGELELQPVIDAVLEALEVGLEAAGVREALDALGVDLKKLADRIGKALVEVGAELATDEGYLAGQIEAMLVACGVPEWAAQGMAEVAAPMLCVLLRDLVATASAA